MVPLTDARIEYVVNGEPREDERRHRHPEPRTDRLDPGGRARPRGAPGPQDAARHRPTRRHLSRRGPARVRGRRAARSAPVPDARRYHRATMPDRSDQPAGPLAGLRVIDCSTVLAGPYCTMLLGDLGAEVIKVEPPEGDATRGWGPPWVGTVEAGTRTAAYFLAVNRNKRGLRLDLKTPGRRGGPAPAAGRRRRPGRELPGRWLRAARLRRRGAPALNPRLVHLAISGYGPERPGGRPARLRLRHPGRRAG